MPTSVFGPHATSLAVFGQHIPLVTTSVFRADGEAIPGALTVSGTGPLGGSQTCPVANGQTMTVSGVGNVQVQYAINDCRDIAAANGAPAQFAFTVSIRAVGTISIRLIPIPVNVQVDSFDIVIATDPAVHAQLMNAQHDPAVMQNA